MDEEALELANEDYVNETLDDEDNEETEEEDVRGKLLLYLKAINAIDDYFEYRMESKKDQYHVHAVLAALTKSLKEG